MNYHAERHALIEYLRVKLVANDWHAVSDAANDLRVLDAQWSAIPKTADKPFQSYFGDSAVDKPESTYRAETGACDPKPVCATQEIQKIRPQAYRTCVHDHNWDLWGDCPLCKRRSEIFGTKLEY